MSDFAKQCRENGNLIGVPYTETFDPYYDNLVLAVPFGGTSAEAQPRNILLNYGVQLRSDWSMYGTQSAYFDGTHAGFMIPRQGELVLAAKDFTIRLSFKTTQTPASGMFGHILGCGSGGTGPYSWSIATQNSGKLSFTAYSNSSGTVLVTMASTTTVTDGVGRTVEVCRKGGSWYLFIDGVQEATATSTATANIFDPDNHISMGQTVLNGSAVGNPYIGYVDGVQIVIGTALHTAAYAPYTSAPTNVPGTQLLLNFEGGAVADDASNRPVIASATATLSSTWARYGTKSAQFNASNGIVARIKSIGSGDFTAEASVRLTSYNAQNSVVMNLNNNFSFTNFFIEIDPSGGVRTVLRNDTGSTTYADINSGAGYVPLNTPVDIAVTFTNNTLRLFVNGTIRASASTPAVRELSRGEFLHIGYSVDVPNRGLTGFIDAVRFTHRCLYTANYTVSATAPTDVANTALLLNFEGASITDDNAGRFAPPRNICVYPQTYVTSESKFGTKALRLTGPNSGLMIPFHGDLSFGNGDWSIEFWVYHGKANQNNGVYVSKNNWASSRGSPLIWNNNGNFCFNATSNSSNYDIVNGTFFGAVQANTWQHVCVERQGSNIRGWVNGVGTLLTSGASTTSLLDGGDFYIGNSGNFYGVDAIIDGLRVTKAAVYGNVGTITVPTSAPTNFSSTVLLLNFEDMTAPTGLADDTTGRELGWAGSATFVDLAAPTTTRTLAFGGNAVLSQAWSAHGGYSLRTQANGDFVSVSNVSDLDFGYTPTLQIEATVFVTGYNSQGAIIAKKGSPGSGNGDSGWSFIINPTGGVAFAAGNVSSNTSYVHLKTPDGCVPLNTKTHIVFTLTGTTVRIYVNGVAQSLSNGDAQFTGTLGSNCLMTAAWAKVEVGGASGILSTSGGTGTPYAALFGYIDSLRILSGRLTYTANFQPPLAAPTNVPGTLLLLNFEEGRLVDDIRGRGRNTITTVYGTPTHSNTQRKFYLASGHFESHVVTCGSNLLPATGDFTIETYFLLTNAASSATQTIAAQYTSAGSGRCTFGVEANKLYIQVGGTVIYSPILNFINNQWYHVRVVRAGNTYTISLDGIPVVVGTASASVDQTTFSIGGAYTTQWTVLFSGYLQDFAVYTTALPTSYLPPERGYLNRARRYPSMIASIK